MLVRRLLPPSAELRTPPTYRELRQAHGPVKAALLFLLYRSGGESVATYLRRLLTLNRQE